MNKTSKSDVALGNRLLVTTGELQALLGCGRASTVRIGRDANARIDVGKRVLWNREKVKKYLEGISV